MRAACWIASSYSRSIAAIVAASSGLGIHVPPEKRHARLGQGSYDAVVASAIAAVPVKAAFGARRRRNRPGLRLAVTAQAGPGRDALRDGYIVAAVVWCLAIALGVTLMGGIDARAYFDARLPDPYAFMDYGAGSAASAGFFYSPPVALALAPLQALGWPLFHAFVAALTFASLYALLGRWAVLGLLFPPVWWDLSAGNINTAIAAAAMIGLRHPAAWAFVLLTKVTPGIGLIWFAARREWRALGIALGVTAGIALASLAVAPRLWVEWLTMLTASTGYLGPGYFTIAIPLPLRVAVAAALVAWGARTNRRWTVAAAVAVSAPVLWFSALAALVALGQKQQDRQAADDKSVDAGGRGDAGGAAEAEPEARSAAARPFVLRRRRHQRPCGEGCRANERDRAVQHQFHTTVTLPSYV
jgi:hypothetical protein